MLNSRYVQQPGKQFELKTTNTLHCYFTRTMDTPVNYLEMLKFWDSQVQIPVLQINFNNFESLEISSFYIPWPYKLCDIAMMYRNTMRVHSQS